jgi:hypothetical protein
LFAQPLGSLSSVLSGEQQERINKFKYLSLMPFLSRLRVLKWRDLLLFPKLNFRQGTEITGVIIVVRFVDEKTPV